MIQASYLIVLAALAVGVLRAPAVAIPAAICMFGLEQWGQASKASLAMHATFTNYAIGVLVVVALARRVIRGECVLCRLTPVYWLTLALFGYAAATLVWGSSSDSVLRQWQLALPYVVTIVFLTPLLARNSADYATSLRWLIVVGGALAIAVLFFATWGRRGVIVASTMYREANPLAIASMAGQVALAALLFPVWRNRLLRWGVTIVVAAVSVAVIMRSGSRGQLLAFFAALAICWPMARAGALSWRLLATPIVLGTFALIAFVSLDLSGAETGRWENLQQASGDAEGRMESAAWLMQLAFKDPGSLLFGLGNSAAFDVYGVYPHIVPLEILAEEGLIGLGLFVALLVLSARAVLRALKVKGLRTEQRAILAAFAAGLIFQFALSFKQGSMLGSPLLFMQAILVARLGAQLRAQARQVPAKQTTIATPPAQAVGHA